MDSVGFVYHPIRISSREVDGAHACKAKLFTRITGTKTREITRATEDRDEDERESRDEGRSAGFDLQLVLDDVQVGQFGWHLNPVGEALEISLLESVVVVDPFITFTLRTR